MKKLAFVLLFVLSGCTQIAVNNRLNELKESVNPLIGKATQEEMIRMFGLPGREEKIGDMEYWYFKISYGVTGSATPLFGSVYSNARERYDEIILGFNDKGILNSARFYVQR